MRCRFRLPRPLVHVRPLPHRSMLPLPGCLPTIAKRRQLCSRPLSCRASRKWPCPLLQEAQGTSAGAMTLEVLLPVDSNAERKGVVEVAGSGRLSNKSKPVPPAEVNRLTSPAPPLKATASCKDFWYHQPQQCVGLLWICPIGSCW